MNSVVRPRGNKAPAVYWRRRIVLLAVVVLVVVGLARWIGGGDDAAPTAAHDSAGTDREQSSARSTARHTAGTQADSRGGEGRRPAAKQGAGTKRAQSGERSAGKSQQQTISTVLAAPEGSCEVGDVVAVPDVVDATAGGPVPLRLGLSTRTEPACTLSLESDKIAIEVTSGDDVIWRSMACDRLLEPQTVVLRRGWVSYVDLNWNGRRGVDDCSPTNAHAKPGYYWAEAALVGGEPHRGQFQLTEKPDPDQADGNGDRARGDKSDADTSDADESGQDNADADESGTSADAGDGGADEGAGQT